MENDELYEQATDLLQTVWRAIDADFKSQYRLEIWRIFEDRVRVAANQNGSLSRFVSQLARNVKSSIGRNDHDRDRAAEVIVSGNDRAILRLYRDETPYLILLLRERMATIREQFDAEHGLGEDRDSY